MGAQALGASPLDELPACSWLLGLEPRAAALVIATQGIVHPSAYIYTCFLHRSYLFCTLWVLTAAWSAFSIALFVGIMQGAEVACECWEWFTLVFAPLMVLLMALLAAHCCCRLRATLCAVLTPALAILYYCLVFYFVFVVNSYRMAQFPRRP